MYFKSSGRHNPKSGKHDWYYRLVESYRNSDGRISHRTILNIGFLDEVLSVDQLNAVSRLLTDRYQQKTSLFEPVDDLVKSWANDLWQRIVKEKRLDLTLYDANSRKIDADTMRHSNVREVGTEWMLYNIWQELKIDEVLAAHDFTEEELKLAQTQVISRAAYPASELSTTAWIKENSAICELTGYPLGKLNKDKLYKGALKLYSVKDVLEQHLSIRTNELFDIQDKIMLYDLTNTYFEGEKRNGSLAKFGRSKEKRNDARQVVLAMVVNIYGFIKYSAIHEGNFSDSSDISNVINGLSASTGQQPGIVVIDAGIATEANLATIRSKGYHYLCVSRKKIKDYQYDKTRMTTLLETRSNKEITLKKALVDNHTDYFLEVTSPAKALKESGMKTRFETRFEEELEKINASLNKKGGIKLVGKVHQRLGRLYQRYPSVHRRYDIELHTDNANKKGILLSWKKNLSKEEEKMEGLGRYFLRTSLDMKDEVIVWNVYNTIREIEATFRTLKSDLDLRPIYHQKDGSTMTHLQLGILAYWLVNTVRCRLKQNKIHHSWQEIVRIGNTQKVITTTGYNAADNEVTVRKCSEPNEKLRQLQAALKIKAKPFKRLSTQKFVVHKPPNEKSRICAHSHFPSG